MIYNVVDFGAKAGAPELQTKAFQAAIDACYQNGGGEVIVPSGTYCACGILLKSRVTLHLMENAVIMGSEDNADYDLTDDELEAKKEALLRGDLLSWVPYTETDTLKRWAGSHIYSRWNRAIIRAVCAVDVAVIGEKGSMLDGVNCVDTEGENNYRGPHGIFMYACRNITLRGYRIYRCGNWAHAIFFCENITGKNLRVDGGHDGFHVRACTNIVLLDSEMRTGDDGVAGFDNINMVVKGCYLNSACNAIRSGGSNVMIKNCVMEGPGEYIFRGSMTQESQQSGVMADKAGRYDMLSGWCYQGDPSFVIREQPGNVIIEDCKIINSDRLIHYNYSGTDPWHSNRPLQNITLRNVEATGIEMPIVLYGDKDIPVDITLDHVKVTFKEGFDTQNCMYLCNYDRLKMNDVSFCGTAGDPVILRFAGNNGEIRTINGDVSDIAQVVDTDLPFTCERF